MKAITVEPLVPHSARYEEVPEPDPRDGSMLVEAVAVGVCGTDLARADRSWLARLLTRRERPQDLGVALERRPDDVKVVVEFSAA